MPNAAASRKVEEIKPLTMASTTPRIMPPTIAPRNNADAAEYGCNEGFNARNHAHKRVNGVIVNAYSTPPAAASAEPRAKVAEITRSILMPISLAASVSNETARMALPILVYCTI